MPQLIEAAFTFLLLFLSIGAIWRLRYGLKDAFLPEDIGNDFSLPPYYARCLILVAVSMLLAIMVPYFIPIPPDASAETLILIALIIQTPLQAAVLIDLLIGIRKSGRKASVALDMEKPDILPAASSALLYVAPVALLTVIISIAWMTQLERLGLNPRPQALVSVLPELGLSPTLIAILLVAVVWAPLYEEIIFRRILMPFLTPSLGLNGAIVASSAAFGLIHFNLAASLPLTLLGMSFCWIYLKSGSLWSAIFLHGLFNLTTVLLTLKNVMP